MCKPPNLGLQDLARRGLRGGVGAGAWTEGCRDSLWRWPGGAGSAAEVGTCAPAAERGWGLASGERPIAGRGPRGLPAPAPPEAAGAQEVWGARRRCEGRAAAGAGQGSGEGAPGCRSAQEVWGARGCGVLGRSPGRVSPGCWCARDVRGRGGPWGVAGTGAGDAAGEPRDEGRGAHAVGDPQGRRRRGRGARVGPRPPGARRRGGARRGRR